MYGYKKQTIWIFLYFTLLITSSKLLLGQVPAEAPKPATFTAGTEIQASPYGHLNFSVPLISVPGSNVFTYNFDLSYQSGISYYEKENVTGVGWNFPQFQIRRTVRGYPDELSHKVRSWIISESSPELRYLRAGRFGWLDYREYNENEGNAYGLLDADGKLLPEFYSGAISEVEDLYELSSPVGSGRLVFHHFEVINEDLPGTELPFILLGSQIQYNMGRSPANNRSITQPAPHYKIYFYLESYQGVKVIYNIKKQPNWYDDGLWNPITPPPFQPETWWEVYDGLGNCYIYGVKSDGELPINLPSGSHSYYWQNNVKSFTVIKNEDNSGQPTLEERNDALYDSEGMPVGPILPLASSIWGLSCIYNPDFPEDYVLFEYLDQSLLGVNAPYIGRRQYTRINKEAIVSGFKSLTPQALPPSSVIERGVRGELYIPYLYSVETKTHRLEFDYHYHETQRFGLPFYHYAVVNENKVPFVRLHNLFLKAKTAEAYIKQIHFTYTDGRGDRLYDDFNLQFEGNPSQTDKLRAKVFLDSIKQYDINISDWRSEGMTYNFEKSKNIPDYILDYYRPEPNASGIQPDVWGYNQGTLPWNPCAADRPIDENELAVMLLDETLKVYYHEYLNKYKATELGGLPDLHYYSGNPASSMWSLKRITYPSGLKKTFYYSPAGEFTENAITDLSYLNPGDAQAPFELHVNNTTQKSGIFDFAFAPNSTEPDLSNHANIEPESITKTIGGPPILVQVETDNGGEKIYDKYRYFDGSASYVPYTIIDDGSYSLVNIQSTTNKRSLFSRYFPYPDVPRYSSIETTEHLGRMVDVWVDNGGTILGVISTNIIVYGILTEETTQPLEPQPFVFFVDPDEPNSAALRTASYCKFESSDWNAHNLIHYNKILHWKSKQISDENDEPPMLSHETNETLLQGIIRYEYTDMNDGGLNTGKDLLPFRVTGFNDLALTEIQYMKEYEYQTLDPFTVEYGQLAYSNRNRLGLPGLSKYMSTQIQYGNTSIQSKYVTEVPVRTTRLINETQKIDGVEHKIEYLYDENTELIELGYSPYINSIGVFKVSPNPANLVTEKRIKTVNIGEGGQSTEGSYTVFAIEKYKPLITNGSSSITPYSIYESNFISGIAEKSIHRGDGTMEEITFYDYEVPEGKTIAKLNTTRSGTGQSELITEEVVARNNQGNIIKLKRAGVGVEYIYANSTEYAGNPGIDLENSSQPIAEIINARLYGTDAEASYCGFELNPENQSGNFEGGWTSTTSTIIVSSDKYTGRHGAEIGASDESNGISKELTPGWGNVNRQVVFSGRIKTSLEGGGRAYMKLQPNGEGCSCYLNKTEQVTIVHIPGIWQYVKIFIPVEGLCSINHNFIAVVYHDGVNGSNIIVDDLRLYPADAAMTTTTYEPRYLQTESITKEDGFTIFYSYDAAGRISFIKDQDFKLIAGYEYEYSRLTNTNGTYDTLIPNNTTTELYMTEQGSIIQTQKTYMDAAGNTLQSISNFGNQPHIAEHEITQLDDEPQSFSVMHKEFDLLNRPEKEYNPIRQYNGFGYQTNVPVLSSAHVENLYSPGDNNHLFITKKYGRDPLGRLTEIVPQGLNYSTGNHSIHYDYSNEILSGTKYNKRKVTDENGNITESLTDIAGNTIKIRRLGQGENPPQIENDFTYNSAGKITQVKDGELKTTSYTYDNAGQLMTRSTPDNGLTENIYDMHGRVRFTRDENHRGNISSIDIDKLLEPREDERLDTYGNFSTDGRSRIKITMNLDFEFGGYGSQPEESYARVIISTASGAEIISLYGDAYDEQITKEITLPAGNYEYYFEAYLEPNVAVVSFYAGLQITCANKLDFIYKKYDKAGRVTEEGEYVLSSEENHFTKEKANDAAFPTTSKVPVREYIYDKGYIIGQANLQGKLSLIVSRDVHGEVKTRTYYSYDNKGRTEWIEEEVAGQRRQIKYTYDFHGRIIKKASMASGGGGDNLYTFYEYDRQGRVQNVYTGTQLNGSNKKREADYQYFADNSVRRLALGQIGENAVQGLDYRYNSRGWLRQINHQNLNNVYLGQPQDPGGDPNDVFGMVLGYDSQDHIAALHGVPAQYNGNISWIMYNMKNVITDTTSIVGYSFKYDPFNRLVAGDFGKYSLNAQMWLETPKFDEKDIQYDKAGNILELKRFGYNGQLMDNLIFNNGSFSSNNRLSTISDNISSGSYSNDIDNQPAGNYSYDGNGNVIRDQEKDVSFIIYNIYNLPEFIAKNDNSVIQYYYNAQGNRNYKLISGNITRYYYGLNGECDSVTDNGSLLFWNINIGNENIGKVSK